MNRNMTERQKERILELLAHDPPLTYQEIAVRAGVPKHSVSNLKQRAGLAARPNGKPTVLSRRAEGVR